MSVRSTAAVFAGALALVLPAAGPSLAYDHDGRGLGELQYRLADGRIAQIRPSDNDTCYRLTHTSENDPAVEVRNDTRSLAVLYENGNCNGEAVENLEPGERARHVEVGSVFFKPREHDHHGGRPGGGDGGWQGGGGDGRGDGGGDGGWQGGGGDGRGDGGWQGGGGGGDGGRGDHGDDEEGFFGAASRALR